VHLGRAQQLRRRRGPAAAVRRQLLAGGRARGGLLLPRQPERHQALVVGGQDVLRQLLRVGVPPVRACRAPRVFEAVEGEG
jgi:hypothetical protein